MPAEPMDSTRGAPGHPGAHFVGTLLQQYHIHENLSSRYFWCITVLPFILLSW